MSTNSIEAKICVLGAQGVGKTSLLQRYVRGTFNPPATASTIGASFLVKKVLDVDSGTTVRLQLWDTAGQERFHAISRLYYRGASAVLLVYSIVDEQSFEDMGRWLLEIKSNLPEGTIIHVVGAKNDVVTQDPTTRKVAFERCIAFVAEHLYPEKHAETTSATGTSGERDNSSTFRSFDATSKRSSGFWGQDNMAWDCCHEISSSTGEGIEEIFRVITRKLVDQKQRQLGLQSALHDPGLPPGTPGRNATNTEGNGLDGHGSFRVGYGDRRRSWLGLPTSSSIGIGDDAIGTEQQHKRKRKGCC